MPIADEIDDALRRWEEDQRLALAERLSDVAPEHNVEDLELIVDRILSVLRGES